MRRILLTLLVVATWMSALAEVKIGGDNTGKQMLVDENGTQLSKYKYSYITNSDTRLKILKGKKDGKWGLLDGKTGKELTEPMFDGIGFWEGNLCIVTNNDLRGCVDSNGTLIIPIEYNKLDYFQNGVARVKKDGEFGYIDFTGKWYATKPSPSEIKHTSYTPGVTPVANKRAKVSEKPSETSTASKTPATAKPQSTKAQSAKTAATSTNASTQNGGGTKRIVGNKPSSKAQPTKPVAQTGTAYKRENRYPFATSRTRFMQLDNINESTISNVQDSIFAIEQRGRISFWTLDGECLFGPDWSRKGSDLDYNEFPMFENGVTVAKSAEPNAAGKEYFALLYKDGHIKELDVNIKKVTQFKDGLAIVEETVDFRPTYYYINLRGEKVFPTLKIYGDDTNAMRPLRCGLRAYCDDNHKWGFIDSKGNVAIKPQFDGVRDFSEDHAWVTTTTETYLINKKLEKVFTCNKKISKYELPTTTYVGDVSDGIFYMTVNDGIAYHDTAGKEMGRYAAGSSFYDGHAFVETSRNFLETNLAMIDTKCNRIKSISDKIMPTYRLTEHGVNFGEYGLATYLNVSTSIAIDSDGDPVLSGWENKNNSDDIQTFSQFNRDGYATIRSCDFQGVRFVGIVRADGEIQWLLGQKPLSNWGVLPKPPIEIEDSTRYIIGDPQPPKQPPVDPEIGTWPPNIKIIIYIKERPRPPKRETAKYTVKVKIEGEGTATVSPSGEFEYGGTATLSAKPAEGWAIANISKNIKEGEEFFVTSNMEITVKFIEGVDIDVPPLTSAFQGEKSHEILNDYTETITIYGEMSQTPNISSPYGDNTYGYLVPMFNPKKLYENDKISCYMFASPMKIVGYKKDKVTGKEYMYADGGAAIVGNLHFKSGAGNMVELFNLMLAFDGFGSPTIAPRSYRIEMIDFDKSTGEFTFGDLEAWSPKYGWLPGGDDKLGERSGRKFSFKIDYGYNHDAFTGTKMKMADVRDDVEWYPPIEWYNNNEPLHHKIVEDMGTVYRLFQTDYEKIFGKRNYLK